MSRLFAFGCSFTNYRWSTWADILGAHYDEYYNWAQSGAGNQFIFNSIMEADQRHRFRQGDQVIVCWTSPLREDRYSDRWQTLGNVMHSPIYREDYKRNITVRGCVIRDLAYMRAVRELLKSRKLLHWKWFSTHNVRQWDLWSDNSIDQCDDVFELYQPVVKEISANFADVLFGGEWPNRSDPHPTPAEHLEFLDQVLPGWVTKQDVRAKIAQETENLTFTRSGLSTVTRL